MLKRLELGVLLFTILTIGLSSCFKDQCTSEVTYIKSEPVYKTADEIRQPLKMDAPRFLKNPGKIYYYNSYVFINEIREGIHIVNNQDPANPITIGFLSIPGNMDMAVKSQTLLADNYTDLLAIDFNDPSSPSLLSRSENVFPSYGEDPEKGILVYFDEKEVTEILTCDDPNIWNRGRVVRLDGNPVGGGVLMNETSGARGGANGGVGGSMARFTVSSNHLYTVDETNLHVFDLNTVSNPQKLTTIAVGWGSTIETIFPYNNRLFIGSNNGMFIYDNTNPGNPTYLGTFWHGTACDPVIVNGDYAYVTLRTGSICDGFDNQLDVVDISDPTNPTLTRTYPMENPHGLSIADNSLYLCEGTGGLKVFSLDTPVDLRQIERINELDTYDVIAVPLSNVLLVVGKDGLYQYDKSDPSSLKQLSMIPIMK